MTNTAAQILSRAKQVARDKYAWPGGYPLYLVMDDGESLCPACVKSQYRLICESTIGGHNDGWKAAGADINYEDDALYCAHCHAHIESAYGETETAGEV